MLKLDRDKQKKHIVLSGLAFLRKLTGIERYTREIIFEMNKLTISESITLLLPEDFDFDCSFTNSISVVRYGFRLGKGNWGAWLWEQLFFALYVKKNRALGVVFSNRVPFFMPDCAVVLHDIAPIVHKEFYDTNKKKLFRAVFEANIWFMERFARAIITVSEFSRTEILKYTKISKEKISVIYPSWQHTERIKPALNVIAKYPFLVGNPYYFSISSMTLNKNFKWIIVAAIHNPGDIFVVGGGGDFLPIVQSICPQIPSNLYFLGYINDEDVKVLMSGCCAFLFPTLYEGFGLPPLEAISYGTRVVVSDTPCMHEVYEDVAYYVDPHKPDIDLEALLIESVGDPQRILDKYRWQKSAEEFYAILHGLTL